jgi:hypothetical protein
VRKGRASYISSRILAGVSVAAAMAILVVVFSDVARDIVGDAKESSSAVLSVASAAVQPAPPQLTAKNPSEPKDSTPLPEPENQTLGLRSVTIAEAPTRKDIKTTLQRAKQGESPQPTAEPTIPDDAIHHLNPDEIAASLGRGNELIASGDLAAARLVLRRAANAGDARAALTLARTYDPAVLAKLGVHGFVPDVAMARLWYEKAKKFGSAGVPERIELVESKRQ